MVMLQEPDVDDHLILTCLRESYHLEAAQISFSPLGADTNTAIYHVAAMDGSGYFLKLRKEGFLEAAVALPRLLYDRGNLAIIPPLSTVDGKLWANLREFTAILYPFIMGGDGYSRALNTDQWIRFGRDLRMIHTVLIPARMDQSIPRETFSPHWRNQITLYQASLDEQNLSDRVEIELVNCMRANHDRITFIVERATTLARSLQTQPLEAVLCHGDLHPGNLLISDQGGVFLIDWDNPVMAPKEHDLMAIGGFHSWDNPSISSWFYQGYGPIEVNQAAVIYYRYERIIQDLALFYEQIFNPAQGQQDREQGLEYFRSNFLPTGAIALADRTPVHRM